VQSTAGPLCSRCGSVRELLPLADAARAATVTVGQIHLAVQTGLLLVWDAAGRSVVCVGCVRALLASNKL